MKFKIISLFLIASLLAGVSSVFAGLEGPFSDEYIPCPEGSQPDTYISLEPKKGLVVVEVGGSECVIKIADLDYSPNEILFAIYFGEGAPEFLDMLSTYHSEEIGLGVLVKLLHLASQAEAACSGEGDGTLALCDVTLEDLIEAYRSGMGLGEIYKLYGKPSIRGVGHVRKAYFEHGSKKSENKANGLKGICNARSKGANAYAKGHGDITCP